MKQYYYDWSLNKSLSLDDACDYSDWCAKSQEYPFAVHPKGFLVFLPPSELDMSDEYEETDPYGVEQNLHNDFHRNRMQCTLELASKAMDTVEYPKILDLGCGQGHITSALKEMLPSADICGLDYSISAINYAAEHFKGIDFVVGNAYEPPYMENCFDLVVCNNLWEHVSDPLHLLEKIRLIMKPNGRLIVSTPSRYHARNLLRVIRGKPVALLSKHHVTEYSVGQVIEQLAYYDFEVEQIHSRPVKQDTCSFKEKILFNILIPNIRRYLKFIGSHHSLESTVFYLAKSNNKTAET